MFQHTLWARQQCHIHCRSTSKLYLNSVAEAVQCLGNRLSQGHKTITVQSVQSGSNPGYSWWQVSPSFLHLPLLCSPSLAHRKIPRAISIAKMVACCHISGSQDSKLHPASRVTQLGLFVWTNFSYWFLLHAERMLIPDLYCLWESSHVSQPLSFPSWDLIEHGWCALARQQSHNLYCHGPHCLMSDTFPKLLLHLRFLVWIAYLQCRKATSSNTVSGLAALLLGTCLVTEQVISCVHHNSHSWMLCWRLQS